MFKIALTALQHTVTSEGQALVFLDLARSRFNLSDRTFDLLRCAIVSHYDAIADTVRDAAPATAFCTPVPPHLDGEFTVAPVDGVQAPPTPRTMVPPRDTTSDMGFELDGVI